MNLGQSCTGVCVFGLALLGCAQETGDRRELAREPPSAQPFGQRHRAIKAYSFEQRDLTVNNLEHVTADLDQRIRTRGKIRGDRVDTARTGTRH
jgi:hypothetical protein